jgi:hypothetical protein
MPWHPSIKRERQSERSSIVFWTQFFEELLHGLGYTLIIEGDSDLSRDFGNLVPLPGIVVLKLE